MAVDTQHHWSVRGTVENLTLEVALRQWEIPDMHQPRPSNVLALCRLNRSVKLDSRAACKDIDRKVSVNAVNILHLVDWSNVILLTTDSDSYGVPFLEFWWPFPGPGYCYKRKMKTSSPTCPTLSTIQSKVSPYLLRLWCNLELNSANDICRNEGGHHAAKDNQRLANAGNERNIIGHNQLTVTELIH